MWANSSDTFFFAWGSPVLAGGGGGGSSLNNCPAGTAEAGGAGGIQPEGALPNTGSGQAALPNTGGGGGGASSKTFLNTFTAGGAGGSGVVVVRYVDEPCVCGN